MTIQIVEIETQKGNVVNAVEFVRGDGTTIVLWDCECQQDGRGLIWRRETLEGENVIAGFETSYFFKYLLTMDDLLVRAGLKEDSPEVREKNRRLRVALARQMRAEKERRLSQRQEATGIISGRRQVQEQAVRCKQEAARLTREDEVRAEKERQRAARKLEVNSRSRRPFWKDGQRLEGIPVTEEEIPALAPIRRDRDGRQYVFAVVMENGEPIRAVKVIKNPGGRPIQHELTQVSFDEPAASQSSSSSNGKNVPSQLPRIWLDGPRGVQKYLFAEPCHLQMPEVLASLQGKQVAVNQPNGRGEIPVYDVTPNGTPMLNGHYPRAKHNGKGGQVKLAVASAS